MEFAFGCVSCVSTVSIIDTLLSIGYDSGVTENRLWIWSVGDLLVHEPRVKCS